MTEKTPQDVVAHHLAALEQGNLANLMADYAEHAVMMFPDRSLRGHDSIKDFFAEALDQYGCDTYQVKDDRIVLQAVFDA